MSNTVIRSFVISMLGIAFAVPAVAQVDDLTNLGDTIAKSIQSKKPEWHYESQTPMKGSEGVIIQQWSSESQSIRVAIVYHKSTEEAAKAMRDTARDSPTVEALADLADEGFSWGRGTVSLRRRNLTIDVRAVTTKLTLDHADADKDLKEEQRLCKEFARLVADAFKGS